MGRLLTLIGRPASDRVLVPLALIGFALARAGRFEERDPYWQARAGMENLAGLPLARPDTWSWAGPDWPWYQNSPLWNTVLGLGYQLGGFWGFFAVTSAVLISYFLLAYLLALRLGARRLPALVGIFAAVAPALAMLSPRGTLVVEVMMLAAVLVAVEWAAHDRGNLPDWLAGAVIGVIALAMSVLGNWLHLSFLLLGPAMAGVWAVIWLFSAINWSRRIWLTIGGGLGWVGGVFLSPYGLATGLERSQVVQEVCTGLILEWTTPFSAEVSKVFWLMVAASTLVAVAVAVWLFWRARVHCWGREETGLLAIAVIGVPAAIAGWAAIRFLGISLLTLAPGLAVVLTWQIDRLRQRRAEAVTGRWQEYFTGAFWRVVVAITFVVLTPGLGYLVAQHSVPAESRLLKQLPAGCQLFSSGAIGGASILVRPDIKVWIDGRADYYGRAHLLAAYAYFGQRAPTLVPPGSTCVVLDSAAEDSKALAASIDASPLWTLASTDETFRMWLPAKR